MWDESGLVSNSTPAEASEYKVGEVFQQSNKLFTVHKSLLNDGLCVIILDTDNLVVRCVKSYTVDRNTLTQLVPAYQQIKELVRETEPKLGPKLDLTCLQHDCNYTVLLKDGKGSRLLAVGYTDQYGKLHWPSGQLTPSHRMEVHGPYELLGVYEFDCAWLPAIPKPKATLAEHLADKIRARVGIWDDPGIATFFEREIENFNAANQD